MASSHYTSLRAALLGLTILVPAVCTQKTTRTITKDIAIVGGGAGGAHAAVRLREDFGKSVVVIEKQGRLVGITLNRHIDAWRPLTNFSGRTREHIHGHDGIAANSL